MIETLDLDGGFRLLHGHVLAALAELPERSVHLVITSPAYWGLRSYGADTWQGGDPTCDHKPGSLSRVGATTLGGGKATAGHLQEGYKGNVCPKCGATRGGG